MALDHDGVSRDPKNLFIYFPFYKKSEKVHFNCANYPAVVYECIIFWDIEFWWLFLECVAFDNVSQI